jgi:hypothetical protein
MVPWGETVAMNRDASLTILHNFLFRVGGVGNFIAILEQLNSGDSQAVIAARWHIDPGTFSRAVNRTMDRAFIPKTEVCAELKRIGIHDGDVIGSLAPADSCEPAGVPSANVKGKKTAGRSMASLRRLPAQRPATASGRTVVFDRSRDGHSIPDSAVALPCERCRRNPPQ